MRGARIHQSVRAVDQLGDEPVVLFGIFDELPDALVLEFLDREGNERVQVCRRKVGERQHDRSVLAAGLQ